MRQTPSYLKSLSSPRSKECLARLLSHVPEPSEHLLSTIPKPRRAAVLVVLFERDGQLRVLLTTRSKGLRTHAGQTALPGGRGEDTDRDDVHTALREANEEIGFPSDSPHVHRLCSLRPYMTKYGIFATPVVVFLDDGAVLDELTPSPDEVENIFDHPLEGFIDPALASGEKLAEMGSAHWPFKPSEPYYNCTDIIVKSFGNIIYRIHRFRCSSFPIVGLTADVLLAVASIAFGKSPVIATHAPGQVATFSAQWDACSKVDFLNVPFAAVRVPTALL